MQLKFDIALKPSYFVNRLRVYDNKEYDSTYEASGKTFFQKKILGEWCIIGCIEDRFTFPCFYVFSCDSEFVDVAREYMQIKSSNENEKYEEICGMVSEKLS